MKSTDNVGITFANLVLGRGIQNSVVNVTLGALEWNPNPETKTVDPSPVIVSRLRLDMACARSLRDNLNELLASVEPPAQTAAPATDTPSADSTAKH